MTNYLLQHLVFILNVLKVSREYNVSLYHWGDIWYYWQCCAHYDANTTK